MLQTESSHAVWINALLGLAGLLTGGGLVNLYNKWLERRRIPAEIEKTHAEARQISAHADSEISESMSRVTLRLEEMQRRVDEIVAERDTANRLASKLAIEMEVAGHQLKQLEAAKYQIKRLKGILDAHGLKYSEFD